MTKTAVRNLKTGDRIVANFWGLSRTEPREILTLVPIERGAVRVTVAEHTEPIALPANARVDVAT